MKVLLLLLLLIGISIRADGQIRGCNSLSSWACVNGECINHWERCDGEISCSDGSDESVEECISFECSEDKFRCAYGGCVSLNAECDGRRDCADNSDELTEKCLPDFDFHGNCTTEQFQCRTGQCIPYDLLCDGSADCDDTSDEQVEFCASRHCSSRHFRCGYGGCIEKVKKCDGSTNCHDQSDEKSMLCNYPQLLTAIFSRIYDPGLTLRFDALDPLNKPEVCIVEKMPRNGWLEYNPTHSEFPELSGFFLAVKYKCIKNHYINGKAFNYCFGGQWQYKFEDCQPFCDSSLVHGVSVVPECKLNSVIVDCSNRAKPGTTVTITCHDRYERDSTKGPQRIMCNDDGTWSQNPDPCTPICGEEAPESLPFVDDGHSFENLTKAPWHVGIYKHNGEMWDLQCGGTIVNARVVISSMHCFWNADQSSPYDLSLFRVTAGKVERDYYASETFQTQFFDVERVLDDPKAHIVLIILNVSIIFKTYIAPICIDYNLQYDELTVAPDLIGRVAGWGLTSSPGRPSEVLKIFELHTVEQEQCKRDSSEGFRPQILPDKFCAGLINSNVSVYQGDNGGGFVLPRRVGDQNVYFLRGIATGGANSTSNCDSGGYSVFTDIHKHRKTVAKEIRYRPR